MCGKKHGKNSMRARNWGYASYKYNKSKKVETLKVINDSVIKTFPKPQSRKQMEHTSLYFFKQSELKMFWNKNSKLHAISINEKTVKNFFMFLRKAPLKSDFYLVSFPVFQNITYVFHF